ncbi:MAG: DNA-formamidopyrimidine glycosylase family protein [Myxococcota bacterium]
MPEGDTIRNLAARLAPVLPGRPIRRAESRWPAVAHGLEGAAVTRIEPLGKHLWLELDDGKALRIHLGMNGKGVVLPPGSPDQRRSLGDVSLRLTLDDAVVEFLLAPTVERSRARERPVHPVLTALGPDLLADDFDVAQVLPRIARSPAPTVAEVLLDQHVACGIGNVYKSEVLFVRRRHPFDAPAAVSEAQWGELYGTARELMLRNLRPGRRITTGGTVPADHYVYSAAAAPASAAARASAASSTAATCPLHLVVPPLPAARHIASLNPTKPPHVSLLPTLRWPNSLSISTLACTPTKTRSVTLSASPAPSSETPTSPSEVPPAATGPDSDAALVAVPVAMSSAPPT